LKKNDLKTEWRDNQEIVADAKCGKTDEETNKCGYICTDIIESGMESEINPVYPDTRFNAFPAMQ